MSLNLQGQRFGRLRVTERYPYDYITPSTQKRTAKWICLCDCGNTAIVTTSGLRSGKTQSCGCLQRERSANAHRKHGGRYDRLHMVWANMKNRCYNANYAEYSSYGGRGIQVCDEWQQYSAFKEWALREGYDASQKRGVQTLDRIDVNADYGPSNCRFVNMYAQANNKQNNIRYSVNGEEHTLSEWARLLDISYNYLYYRVKTKHIPLDDVIKTM